MADTTKMNPRTSKAGIEALLTPDNCVLILIDHQAFQFAGLRSHDTQTVINNVVGLAKSAKAFKVPTLLSTVVEARGGYLLKQLQDVFPDQKPIDRTTINTWEDSRAGTAPLTWGVFAAELQRDWARTATVPAVAEILIEHAGVVGSAFLWEQQLLATAQAAVPDGV